MNRYSGLWLLVALSGIVACSGEKKKNDTEIRKSEKQQLIMVDTLALRKQSFQKQMICNGKLRAVVKSDINFQAAGIISAIHGGNGDYVEKGSVIAALDDEEALIELEKSKREMERANIDLLDKLIGQGYAGDTAAVPAAVLRNLKISSGYSNAVDQLKAAERRLSDCYLKAPFGGRIANLDMKVYDRSGNKLCTLIDDSYFDVEFSVLEAEIEDVALKQRVKVMPFINEEKVFYGKVTEINPFIDEYGQVKVRARVENADGYLVEGMNVKLVLEREVKDCFVVPKDAVVLRDGFQVVFCYRDGKAVWTYVDVVMSNINSHVITGCKEKQTTVSENDVVITSNNLNLADGTDVTPKKENTEMIKRLLQRPIGVSMSVIAIVVLSMVAMGYLPVSLMPDIDIPKITIQVSAPGLSVREVDNTLLKPLKNQLAQVAGLENITAEARADAGAIYMDFEPNSNIDLVFIDVNEKLDRAVTSLPKDVERPKVVKASVTDIPAFYLNLKLKGNGPKEPGRPQEAGVDFGELGQFARDVIAKRIEQLPQTAMVDISGVVTPELLCVPDYKKLTSMGADVGLLENAINSNNISLGALSIRDGEFRYSIHFDSKIVSKEDIENIFINHKGRIYRFKELCRIVERPAKQNGWVRSGDAPAVTLAIIKQSDARMADLQEGITGLIEKMEKEHPDISFELTRDQTRLLAYSIDNLGSNLLVGAVLAALIIFLFMRDFRSPLLIVVTIPLSLIVTLLVFYVMGMSLNVISLSGLILGTGMMVDNSIIVIDNVFQKWQRDSRLDEAISKAVKEVFAPMLSSVLTTCSVFLPLIFLSGTAGALFYDQAMAVTIALFASLLVSVLVLPVYFYMMYRKTTLQSVETVCKKRFSFDYYRPYEEILKWTLRHGRWVVAGFIALVPLTVWVYPSVEKSRLPHISHDDAILTVDWNSGISVEENDLRTYRLLTQVDSLLVQSTSMVGVQQFMMSHTKETTPSESIVYVKTESAEELEQVKEKIAGYMAENYPKARVEFQPASNIFNMIFTEKRAPLVAQLHSKEGQAPTVEQVTRLIGKLQETLPDVRIPRVVTEQNICYMADVEAMALYEVTFEAIYSKMKNVVSQNVLFRINQGSYSVPVTTGESQAEAEDILMGKVRNRHGVEVPLSMVIRETKSEDFKKLFSGSGGDYYPIPLEVKEGKEKQVMEAVENVVKEDGDFFVTFTGEYFSSRETIGELIVILLVAISLLYFILAAQFESVVQPLIILSEIVVDIFFVLLGLWVFGESLNIMSMIGLVVMSGIIINDSILKVDTINRLRKEGMSLIKAVFVGGHSRLKPIVMTSLTTILAIVPFLNRVDMGSDLQYPLSLTIIIGMTAGTCVSLFFIPLLYYIIYHKRSGYGK